MNLSQRNRNIILWIIAIGLLISMVISFTPGTLFGGAAQRDAAEGPVALNVNGEPVRQREIERLEQNPPFNAVQEGPVAEDLERVVLSELVSQSLVEQAAADIDVSGAEVRARVDEFRDEQGVAGSRNDGAYQNLIAGGGYTDETFREFTREQLQQEKYLEGLTEGVSANDEEIRTHHAANRNSYSSEPRITAREIVMADEAEADLVYARALDGEDFAALAREASTERAEQGGALGAAEGESAPKPITRVALPTGVAQAAFALQGPGLTTPVEAGGAFHIVKVEAFQPAAPRPLDEVRGEVEADVLELKKAAAQEAALRELRANADVSAPEGSTYSFENLVVARVGDAEIRADELDRNTYLNPQLQQFITPDFGEIITTTIRPNVLEGLIDEELAFQGAGELDGTFVGPRASVAQSALGYVSRDAQATDAQIRTFYGENEAEYTEPPSALTTRVNFPDVASARDFRRTLTGAGVVDTRAINLVAEASDGTVQDVGEVAPGAQPEVIDAALFNFGAAPAGGMVALADSGLDISSVLTVEAPAAGAQSGGALSGGVLSGGAVSGGAASGGAGGASAGAPQQFVVLIAARTPPRVPPLSEVRAQVEQAATQQQQNEARTTWLEGLRESIPVENLLAAELAADAQNGAQSGGSQSGGAPSEDDSSGETQDDGVQNGGAQDDVEGGSEDGRETGQNDPVADDEVQGEVQEEDPAPSPAAAEPEPVTPEAPSETELEATPDSVSESAPETTPEAEAPETEPEVPEAAPENAPDNTPENAPDDDPEDEAN